MVLWESTSHRIVWDFRLIASSLKYSTNFLTLDECGFMKTFLSISLFLHYSDEWQLNEFPHLQFLSSAVAVRMNARCGLLFHFVITAPSNSYHSQLFCLDVLNLCNKLVRFNYAHESTSLEEWKRENQRERRREKENSELLWQRAAQRCSQLVTDVTSPFRVLYHFFFHIKPYSSYRIQFIAQQCQSIALSSLL